MVVCGQSYEHITVLDPLLSPDSSSSSKSSLSSARYRVCLELLVDAFKIVWVVVGNDWGGRLIYPPQTNPIDRILNQNLPINRPEGIHYHPPAPSNPVEPFLRFLLKSLFPSPP